MAEGDVTVAVAWEQDAGEHTPTGPVAQYLPDNQDPVSLKTGLLELRRDVHCGEKAPATWPIWGEASLGSEFKASTRFGERKPSFILHGDVKIEARSLWPNTTYPVDPVTLPVGGRLETAQERPGDPPTQWWGLAYVDPQKPALVVAAGTEARVLRIYRPLTSVPDIIELSFFNRFFDDPALKPIHAFAGGLGVSWLFRRRENRNHGGHEKASAVHDQ
jgi:hypothetical protein